VFHRLLRTIGTAAWLVALGASAAASATTGARAKLDPSLRLSTTGDCEAPRFVWLELADKGEQGPSDLASRLADAQAGMEPRALARRQRAGLSPIVDWLDLPVHQPYLDTLAARGFRPFGASRWFNRVGVVECDPRILQAAELPFVRRVSPPEWGRAQRVVEHSADIVRAVAPAKSAAVAGLGPGDYGVTLKQLQQIGATAVHDSGYSGAGVLIAVFDEGFNYFRKHEALRDLDVGGRTRDFVEGDLDVQDTLLSPAIFQHGTWCLSAIGGNRPGAYVGPGYGASFALARTENSASEKPIEMVWWAMAAEWADSLGADIISSSLGYNTFPDSAGTDLLVSQLDGHTATISRAAQIAASRGILVVSSAGNSGSDPTWDFRILFPADVNGDSLLAVGSVDSNGVRASSSSQGPTADGRTKPDLMARGSRAWLASAGGNPQAYITASGTSFSCPLVAGLAACIWQAHPTWPAVWVAQALKRTASRASNPDNFYGWGLPSGPAALRHVPDTAGVPGPGGPVAMQLLGPNPLVRGGPDVRVRFAAAGAGGPAVVRVYDALGREVRELWRGVLAPGVVVTATWDGLDAGGRAARPGIFFVRLEARGGTAAVRLASLR
jgi:subtilisin family serine protease